MNRETKPVGFDTWSDECIEPTLGAQIDRLDDADCPQDLHEQLTVHARYCEACRNQLAVMRAAAAELQRKPPARAWWPHSVGAMGGLATAAGLVLMLTLPPRPDHGDHAVRNGQRLGIQRPVSGEHVAESTMTIRWTRVDGAARYRVELEQVGSDSVWQSETADTAISMPTAGSLPSGERFRIRVEPVPGYLGPDGGWTTSARTSSLSGWLWYRLGHGSTGGAWTALAGLLALGLAMVAGLRSNRG